MIKCYIFLRNFIWYDIAGTNKELCKMNIVPLQSDQCPVSPLNGSGSNISAVKFVSKMLRCRCCPPGCRMLWYVTLCCRFSNSHFYQLLFAVQSHGFISNTAALFPLRLWRSTMSAKHSRICAIRSPSNVQCATHCARIDFLWRPSWQIPLPGGGPARPITEIESEFQRLAA